MADANRKSLLPIGNQCGIQKLVRLLPFSPDYFKMPTTLLQRHDRFAERTGHLGRIVLFIENRLKPVIIAFVL